MTARREHPSQGELQQFAKYRRIGCTDTMVESEKRRLWILAGRPKLKIDPAAFAFAGFFVAALAAALRAIHTAF